MNPIVIHRYSLSSDELAEIQLAGDVLCERTEMRLDGDRLVLEVYGPLSRQDAKDLLPLEARPITPPALDEIESPMPASQAIESAQAPPPASDRRGGVRARRAAMLCQELGFRTFLAANDCPMDRIDTAEQAAREIYRRINIQSRADLDHDEAAGTAWDKLEGRYRLWNDGYDVD